MLDPRHHLASRLRPHLLPLVRRIAEDVLQEVIQRRSMPSRTEFREMQAHAAEQARELDTIRTEYPRGTNPSRSDGP